MTQTQQYVATFPEGGEYFFEKTKDTPMQDACQKLVYSMPIRTSRKNPRNVRMDVHQIVIQDYKQVRRKVGTYEARPHLDRMTTEEFREEMDTLLRGLPVAFHRFVQKQAEERSSTLEERIDLMGELIDELEEPLNEFRRFITSG